MSLWLFIARLSTTTTSSTESSIMPHQKEYNTEAIREISLSERLVFSVNHKNYSSEDSWHIFPPFCQKTVLLSFSINFYASFGTV